MTLLHEEKQVDDDLSDFTPKQKKIIYEAFATQIAQTRFKILVEQCNKDMFALLEKSGDTDPAIKHWMDQYHKHLMYLLERGQ